VDVSMGWWVGECVNANICEIVCVKMWNYCEIKIQKQ
jgi:hypothetical protein